MSYICHIFKNKIEATTMKTTNTNQSVSKSSVMNRAWRIFRQHLSNFRTFSDCLSRAWKVEKENLKYSIEKAILEAGAVCSSWVNMGISMPFKPSADTMQSYYNSNAYKGD